MATEAKVEDRGMPSQPVPVERMIFASFAAVCRLSATTATATPSRRVARRPPHVAAVDPRHHSAPLHTYLQK